MENSLGFTWLCLIIANMWMIASYFSDKPYLNLIGMAWILLGAISLLTSSNSELIKLRYDRAKFEIIVHLLEQIAGKKKIKTKTSIKK
jgi:hypothetical protein